MALELANQFGAAYFFLHRPQRVADAMARSTETLFFQKTQGARTWLSRCRSTSPSLAMAHAKARASCSNISSRIARTQDA
eukprot:1868282-Pyramimonas_sp.AAC.1